MNNTSVINNCVFSAEGLSYAGINHNDGKYFYAGHELSLDTVQRKVKKALAVHNKRAELVTAADVQSAMLKNQKKSLQSDTAVRVSKDWHQLMTLVDTCFASNKDFIVSSLKKNHHSGLHYGCRIENFFWTISDSKLSNETESASGLGKSFSVNSCAKSGFFHLLLG